MEIRAIDISKQYGKKLALDKFSYTFTPGVYALIGPNGAGKTTLMNILTQNLSCDSGVLLFDEKEVKNNRTEYLAKLGYMPQQQAVFPTLSLHRFMFYMAALKGIQHGDGQIEALLKQVDLWDVRNKKLGSFSGGMKQRALLAQAFLGEPSFIILDEPTEGLDPLQRITVRKMIKDASKNAIVLVSSHVLADLEQIADKVILLKKGHRVESETEINSKSLEEMYVNVFGDKDAGNGA